MSKRLFVTTAVGLIFGTAAWAQAPNSPPASTTSPSALSQSNPASPSRSQPASSAQNNAADSAAPHAQPPNGGTTAGQSASSDRSNAAAPSRADSNPADANGANTNASNNNPSNANSPNPRSQAQTNPANARSQAQTAAPSGTASQSQNSNAAPVNNQAQQAPRGAAQQRPNPQENLARSGSTDVNGSVNINDQQRIRISESVMRLNARPLTNVNFSLSVGATIPRDVRLEPLPDEVVRIVPQYRGYDFVLVRDDIVIVEPSSSRIVAVLPRSGGSTATENSRRKVTFSDRDREVIRKHARASTERRTTGSTASMQVRMGERVPDSVTIEEFPEEVYRESPALREYRYIQREDRTYVVEPQDRRIIEEID